MTTAIDIVREYFPDASLEDADTLLWGATCFPFSVDAMRKQLSDLRMRSNGRFLAVCLYEFLDEADAKMERDMRDFREKEEKDEPDSAK